MRGDRPLFSHYYIAADTFTPHARGSTEYVAAAGYDRRVYPACAGIDPGLRIFGIDSLCLPRMRGDRPDTVKVLTIITAFTPHARGSTQSRHERERRIVYPACAGIDPCILSYSTKPDRLPRMRGDRPANIAKSMGCTMFTPHARGPTGDGFLFADLFLVYPACAGIDR